MPASLKPLALPASLVLAAFAAAGAWASDTPAPTSVVVPGSLQSELGCPGDWQPDCADTALTLDAEDQVWQGTFDVPAGMWEYKAALNGGWDENYGLNAARNGANIPLTLAEPAAVKFYYDHETHWITSNRNSVIAVAAGSFQSELGCAGDWDPSCLRSWLKDPDGDGVFTLTVRLPAGDYEAKVAIGESWSENYGAGGAPDGPNIPFTVDTSCREVLFRYDATTHVLTIGAGTAAAQPASVTIAGSLQSELGCPGDWQPECAATHLTFDADDQVWQGSFDLPAGGFEYKAALDDGWTENYGARATRDGANIPLDLAEPARVKFYYDHATHWVTDNRGATIVTAPGSYQSELGCAGDWDPSCLRSWLQDPDGDGVYTFSTRGLPAGSYEVKVAIDESWDENYGEGGVRDGANIPFTVSQACGEVVFTYVAATHVLTVGTAVAIPGDLSRARAHWLCEDTIAWNPAANAASASFALHFAPGGGLTLGPAGVEGGQRIPLSYEPAGLTPEQRERFPHLAGYAALRLPADRLADVPSALTGQLAVSAADGAGAPLDATSVQIPGVLDDLFAYEGPLGVVWDEGAPTLRVWAPTARSVKLHLFADSAPATPPTTLEMSREGGGTWSLTGGSDWRDRYYLYEVEVYVPATGRVERNLVTDPYSLSLARDSARSQIVDLRDRRLAPPGWDHLQKPRLGGPQDITLYELHVRDFSAQDPSVPASLRGTFKAFTLNGSKGMRHLRSLARAGLTHVHLLPSFDLATVPEDRARWLDPGDLSVHPPDSEAQQAAVMAIRDQDGFNWGYDPWHYTVPEGSYATDADGPGRIREFREMVQSLNRAGLRVVMDVVYNHTTAGGQSERSVLDRIVPGYYHRLTLDGAIETSTCCANTATEHRMMEKLMLDSALTWARDYKVDGFRFDLMGHHMKANMLRLREALDRLRPQRDGVDGRAVYLYGEGWNFGEVANDARGVNATQLNMAGTGIGTFSDRLRDGARGGGPFSGLQDQGFLTGLWSDPNGTEQGDQRSRLLQYMDWIRVGLSGNLAGYTFTDRFGHTVTGAQVDYHGQPAGYAASPTEVISYVEAHDNETLFDAIALKAPVFTASAQRVRMQNLGVSLVGLGQGVPFFHAGVELLRSKSLDRNSYNSGDWFNTLDFTYQSNNWGVGLPPAPDNQGHWPVMQPLLANPDLRPSPDEIAAALAHFHETLAIRGSTRLFRLGSADEVKARVRFHNTGPDQTPGVLVMSVSGAEGSKDRHDERVVVVWNATPQAVSFRDASFEGLKLALHPVQKDSADPVVRAARFDSATGEFTVPGRTAAVFWTGHD
ncbi:MAG TPA: pullulanase-type alpha-1,6-glucosidase [Vicinamibacteria bacterium]|nr:pullulanase-type alpha-1,6-glucosidase [Vicinamibacteria bacterium]